jgi:indolepyruvate ferredoxin oxidoreductase
VTDLVEDAPGAHDVVYDLSDRYRSGAPAMLLTGVQAIARLLVEHRAMDRRQGLRTATFVSGYPGSPLGGVDRLLMGMSDVLAEHDIRFVPGLNEELAATAVWGSQADETLDHAAYDGVTGVWFGKGPGLDRATDALRHANLYGVHPCGGVLLLVGDDPAAKSSTVPAVSERSLAALGIPVLFPRNAAEIVTLGLHGIRLSRASGCVVALKIVADVADGAWIVGPEAASIAARKPAVDWDGEPFVYRQRPLELKPDAIVGAEAALFGPRTAAVHAYAAANELNRLEVDQRAARLGIVGSGSCFDSLRQALRDLGVSDDDLATAGIRLLRLGMLYPLEPTVIERFADGLDQMLVVEDKTPFIETAIRDLLYARANAPVVLGKRDGDGRALVPVDGELTAGRLQAPLRHVLQDRVNMARPAPRRIDLPLLTTSRTPYFCSGCPHNRSTAVPDGSLAGGGIGCHTLVTASDRTDSAVVGLTQMGGEGAQWIGQTWFSHANHVFQNVGDGTYFHSAQLSIQACVAAGVNITFKILYNDVVAMTGAQDPEGALSVPKLTHKLTTEGVVRIIVCADEPERHRRRDLAPGTLLWHRDRLDEAQRLLRDTPGVTVLIYDQHCAADARRQRKRGRLAPRNIRVIINEAVCEGCGDCGKKSNCLSVQPVDTEFGRKTRIDQSSCNTDYTCLDGDCPSFVTVEVDPSRAVPRSTQVPVPPQLADPLLREPDRTYNVFLTGIGGTGIVTVNQVLATAALRAGYQVEALDQVGMSQKAGPVTAHLRFGPDRVEPSNRLTPGAADCILGFDLLTLAEPKNLAYGDQGTTVAVVSTSKTPTGAMVHNPSIGYPDDELLLDHLDRVTESVMTMDALEAARNLFGDTVEVV